MTHIPEVNPENAFKIPEPGHTLGERAIVTGATPERFGNTAQVAHDAFVEAGLNPADWVPGKPYPETYVVYTVSEQEVCPYCNELKEFLKPYIEDKKIVVRFKSLSREDRQKLYHEKSLVSGLKQVPLVFLYDRRADCELPIGDSSREHFMKWFPIAIGDTAWEDIYEV